MGISKKLHIEDFKASNDSGSFLLRNSINSHTIWEEANTVLPHLITRFKERYYNKLEEYDEKCIFNCYETGLFYNQTILKTYICSDEDKANRKVSIERKTILFLQIFTFLVI